ncbi:MAG TPA: hypothetical protein VHF51_02845, partial [Solirubrobacteraceae bacterium]|nr:hypothetical protein [Solirubrobacteraceae bacterium]
GRERHAPPAHEPAGAPGAERAAPEPAEPPEPEPRTGSIPPPSAGERPAQARPKAKPVGGFSLLFGALLDRIKRLVSRNRS